ncbi:DUF4209 domain-containing protein [Kribbella sp. NPDC020789]
MELEKAASSAENPRQREVLTVLSLAASPVLDADDWANPFKPAFNLGGRRSVVPADLQPAHLDLLGEVVSHIEQPSLRGRVADILWLADRSDLDHLGTAIDAYRSSPLETDAWLQDGRNQWRRAFELATRRGGAERERTKEMTEALRVRVLAGNADDRFVLAEIASVLGDFARLTPDERRAIADHLAGVAATASAQENYGLARRLEREAAEWFGAASDNDAVLRCKVRIADAYFADASLRRSSGQPASSAAHFMEKAVSTLRVLPRKFRDQEDLDGRLADWRAQLADLRRSTVDEMLVIESESTDIAGYVGAARRQVRVSDPLEALVRLSFLQSITDCKKARIDAETRVRESFVYQISGRTSYSEDARKIATTLPTVGSSGVDEDVVRAEMIQAFGIRIVVACQGLIHPALEVVAFEHRLDQAFFLDLCRDAPVVPQEQERLWARGLLHGIHGDFASGAFILAPLIENLVRSLLKVSGVYTLLTDERGLETEKGLSALLKMPEAEAVLGADLVFELRALLVDQEGPNLRNNLSHGLVSDAGAWSCNSMYLWWLCLGLVVKPVYQMRRGMAG